MVYKTTEICNEKIRLHSVHTNKFKASRFSINFITNSDRVYSPLSKLMLSVMMRGSEKYPTVVAINKALDEQYGATVSVRSSIMGDKAIHRITCKLLNDKYVFEDDTYDILESVMSILSDILMHPLKDANGLLLSSYVESEKKIAIDHINAKINDPKSYASEQCSKHMFEGTDFGVSIDGDANMIGAFSAEQITENISAFFNECRIECYYIGDKSHENVELLIEKYLSFGNNKNDTVNYTERPYINQEISVKYINEDADISQGRLVLGYRCGTVLSNRDYYDMALFNELFGGSSVSKLFLNVREKKSLCYYCYSSLHSATGTIKVGCGIDPGKKDEALDEIAVQLNDMKNGNFTDDDITTAKHTLISGMKQIGDSPSSIEAFMLRRLLADAAESPQDCCERVLAVTREGIISAANKVELDTVYFLNGNDCCEEDDYE